MNKSYTYSMLEPIITEKLNSGATVTIMPKGTSMLPLLRQGIDEVVLKKSSGHLKKYDIPFYKRNSGQFVLHRIVDIKKDGYVLCGDNQFDYEYGITDDMILAVADCIIRDGKKIRTDNPEYIKYCKKQIKHNKIRRLKANTKRFIKKILGKK